MEKKVAHSAVFFAIVELKVTYSFFEDMMHHSLDISPSILNAQASTDDGPRLICR